MRSEVSRDQVLQRLTRDGKKLDFILSVIKKPLFLCKIVFFF